MTRKQHASPWIGLLPLAVLVLFQVAEVVPASAGMMGRIEVPRELELDVLLSYLQQHAQKPIGQELRGALETRLGMYFSPSVPNAMPSQIPSSTVPANGPRWWAA